MRGLRRGPSLAWAGWLALAAACGSGAPDVEEAAAPAAAPPSSEAVAAHREVVRAPRMDGDVVLVDVDEVRAKLAGDEPPLVIDARPAADYEHEHIAGAINIPLSKLAAANELPGVPHEREIVVYCIAPECPISKNAARVLARLGYLNVRDMREGLMGWKRAGLETVRGGS